MRISFNTMPDSLASQLNLLAAQQYRLQTQVTTGRRITNPEDDPAGMRRALDLETETSALQQQQRNISQVQDEATATADVLNGLKKISDRAGELAILADDTRSPEELKSYGQEISQLIEQAVQLVNTQHNGEYLLGGTRSDQPPFTAAFDANGLPTGVTYQGNTSVREVEIAPGSTVSGQTLGANDTGAGPRGLIADSRAGADFFNHLISLQNHLLAGDTAAIAATDHANLAKDEDNILYQVATNGALQSRLESTHSLASSRALGVSKLASNETDADLAQTLVQLNRTQTAYQAALSSGARLMSQSLLDYLQ
jgi:flagellar hook-associated protein 3 FlgL